MYYNTYMGREKEVSRCPDPGRWFASGFARQPTLFNNLGRMAGRHGAGSLGTFSITLVRYYHGNSNGKEILGQAYT